MLRKSLVLLVLTAIMAVPVMVAIRPIYEALIFWTGLYVLFWLPIFVLHERKTWREIREASDPKNWERPQINRHPANRNSSNPRLPDH